MVYKLLLVDDEKPILDKMFYNTNWKQEGYKVFSATDGINAFQIIKKETVDILVTDIKMPKLNGMELIEKSQKVNEQLKIIVISGFADFKYAQKSIELGVSQYILKPFSSKRLLLVVNEIREALNKEKEGGLIIRDLRDELLVNMKNKQVNEEYNFIINDKFFQQQIIILKNIQFDRVLLRGSKEDVIDTANKIIERLNKELINKEKFFIILNNLILECYKIIKDCGYSAENLLIILNNIKFKEINHYDIKEMVILVRSFLLNIHTLISYNNESRSQELINKIKEYISENYQYGLTLNEIAKEFNFSASYISNLFYEKTGEHFSDYINMLKLKKAKELLKTTDLKIYQIADKLGFNNAFYFSTWFKNLVGASPTVYRDNINLL